MGDIRLLDLGLVPSLRSQTIYHALAHGMTSDAPDTVALVSSLDPYVCVGFHQDLEREVDLASCQAEGLPVYRREVGGGAVYLDRNQIFTQWVFHREHLPPSVESRFELHARPIVETYRALGIEAQYRPINDIQVRARKIGGMGAAAMGEAEVVVCSLMFDFDSSRMVRILNIPSEKMRDKVYQSLREYMTTMAIELGTPPDREGVKAIYSEKLQETLGARIVPGVLTNSELAALDEWDRRLLTREWLYQRGRPLQPGVKIHDGVSVLEGVHKAPGGLIRALVRLRDGRIDDIDLSGDFTMLPASGIARLEESAVGAEARAEAVLDRFREVYRTMGLKSPGVTADDFASVCEEAIGRSPAR